MYLKKISDLRNTLFFRLMIQYAATFILIAVLAFFVFYWYLHRATMENLDEELVDDTEVYAQLLKKKDLAGLKARITDQLEAEDRNEEFMRLIDFYGNTLSSTDMSGWPEVDKAESLARLKEDSSAPVLATIESPDDDYQARMVSAVLAPNIVLQIGESLEDVDDYLAVFRTLLIVLTMILILVAAFIGWLMAKRALKDMQQVTETAEHIARGAYDTRVEVTDQFDEIKKLGSTFNNMLDQIQNLLKSMKDINDNIAHDLRSPLARIRGIAEMTLRDDKPIDDYREMAVSTIEECDSLIEMINTMLDITEAEAGVNGSSKERFDVSALVMEACELFRPMAEARGIALRTNIATPIIFRGDKKKMQRIVTNIVENAIKYTPDDGKVEVTAATDNGKIQIIVNDTGIGIAEDDLPHIFDRFYRCDPSRTESGVGLGLSLAKAYAESMRGLINVKSVLGRGSTFILQFES